MAAYYNEIDPYAAQWLRNLIAAGHIAPGDVDERSIAEVQPDDLRDYDQCHFFAGIGGWSRAARLAGLADDARIWTGSCPCQPFSAAGKQRGTDDERHLWPEFQRLIAECRPATVFGEQVASRLGRDWLARVRTDLEDMGYAVGAADLCAAGVAAPHIRQRLYWVADAQCGSAERQRHQLADAPCQGESGTEQRKRVWHEPVPSGPAGGMGDTDNAGPQGWSDRPGESGGADQQPVRSAGFSDFWSGAVAIPCRDDKWRRIEPSSFPLAHGVPARVGRIRAYGNAIVPQVAAAFISASFLATEAA